jgi:cell wall-associated NlpC family hydrolase
MGNVVLSPAQIAGYAQAAGVAGPDLTTAVAVALAESGGNTWAIDNDTNGSQDQGLWQINTVHASQFPGMTRDPGTGSRATVGSSSIFDPASNAKAMYLVSSGGSSWTPWSTYTSGAYRQHLGAAQNGAANPTISPDSGTTNSLGGSAGAAEPSLGYALVDDHDIPIVSVAGGDQITAVPIPSQIQPLIIAGLADVSGYVTDGSVELDADQLGQIQFTVQDQFDVFGAALTKLNTSVTYAGMKFQISTVETQATDQPFPVYQITATVAVAHQMKILRNPPTMPNGVSASSGDDTLSDTPGSADTDPGAADASDTGVTVVDSTDTSSSSSISLPQTPVGVNPDPSTTITPTDYVNFWCQALGGNLVYGQETYTQAVISPLPVTQGLNPAVYGETLYDVINRIAGNYGYWFFDADGTNVYFGAPGAGQLVFQQGQGIMARATPFRVGWNGAWGNTVYDAIQYPDCRVTTDDILTPATVIASLDRARGEQVRPGMCMWLKGVTGFDADGDGQPYIVTKVSWAMDSGQTPAQITAVTPVDPVPNDISLLPQPVDAGIGTNGQNQNPAQQTPLSSDPTLMHLSDDFVTEALMQVGKPYVWGAVGPTSFDCSGLVEYCAARVGIAMPPPGYTGSRSQQQYLFCASRGTTIPVQQAANTRGALLFTGTEGDEHVGISLGNADETVEAPHTGTDVQVITNGTLTQIESRFQYGALIPGMDYSQHVSLGIGTGTAPSPGATPTNSLSQPGVAGKPG